jgi:hopene-associated glycosyltransferase HpnB
MTWYEATAWIPAAIWAYLLACRGLFWVPTVRLRDLADPSNWPDPSSWPPVAVVVPARDEAPMIAQTMPSLLDQDYPGPAEVILVDDCSTDGTADSAAAVPGLLPLRVVNGAERPEGWVGKTWALQQGYQAAVAGDTPPEFLLFTDADIKHPRDSLRQLVGCAVGGERDLVSLMALLHAQTGWEKLIVPAFVYFFSQLYPFRLVSRRRSRTAAAAGGCMLVRRAALERAGGIKAIAGAVIDDVALAQAVQRAGGTLWLGYATRVRSIRSYPRLSDLWNVVARSAYTQLRYSPVTLAGTIAGLFIAYEAWLVVLIVGLARDNLTLSLAGAVAWALLTVSYVPMVVYYRLSPWRALTLPLVAGLYGAMTVDSAWRHRRGVGAEWKGRTYSPKFCG